MSSVSQSNMLSKLLNYYLENNDILNIFNINYHSDIIVGMLGNLQIF